MHVLLVLLVQVQRYIVEEISDFCNRFGSNASQLTGMLTLAAWSNKQAVTDMLKLSFYLCCNFTCFRSKFLFYLVTYMCTKKTLGQGSENIMFWLKNICFGCCKQGWRRPDFTQKYQVFLITNHHKHHLQHLTCNSTCRYESQVLNM